MLISYKIDRVKRALQKARARLFLPPQKSHWHSWQPRLSIEKASLNKQGEISYRSRLAGNLKHAAYLKSEAEKEIIVVGSGPSIRTQNLASLPTKSTILLNGAISLIPSQKIIPLAIAIEDDRFVAKHFAMMKSCIPKEAICLFSPSVLRAIAERDENWLLNKTTIMIDNVCKPFEAERIQPTELINSPICIWHSQLKTGFSLGPHVGIFGVGTVAYTALQFATFCRPELIGLAGIDLTNANQPRFYETSKNKSWSGIDKAQSSILNGFQLGSKILAKHDIELENYSEVSTLKQIGIKYKKRI